MARGHAGERIPIPGLEERGGEIGGGLRRTSEQIDDLGARTSESPGREAFETREAIRTREAIEGGDPASPRQLGPNDRRMLRSEGISPDEFRELSSPDRRLVRGHLADLEKHQHKLRRFLRNPDYYDNKGHLKNAGDNAVLRRRIISTRKDGLIRSIELHRSVIRDVFRSHRNEP